MWLVASVFASSKAPASPIRLLRYHAATLMYPRKLRNARVADYVESERKLDQHAVDTK